MNEQLLVPISSVGNRLLATALRPEGDSAWHVFVSVEGHDLWLCIYDCREVQPLHFAEESDYYAKLCLLIGEPWTECWFHTRDVLKLQRTALEQMGPKLRRKLRNSSVLDVANWREEMQTVEPGELLRERMAGVDPLAGRN